MTISKTCGDCGRVKPLDEFFREKLGKYGRRSNCKACKTAKHAGWVAANRDHVNAYMRMEQKRPHRAAQRAEYLASDRAKALNSAKERRPETRLRRKAYLLANPAKAAELNANRHARRRARKLGVHHEKINWPGIQHAHGFACYYCGTKPERLTQDHHVPLSRGGPHTTSNVVPACRPCNSMKKNMMPEVFAARRPAMMFCIPGWPA